MVAQVFSELTNRMEICTMRPGFVSELDGVRVGAMPDVEMFSLLEWETEGGDPVDIVDEWLGHAVRGSLGHDKSSPKRNPFTDPESAERMARVDRYAEQLSQSAEYGVDETTGGQVMLIDGHIDFETVDK